MKQIIFLVLLISFNSLKAQSKHEYIQIAGEAKFLKDGDTVQLRLYKYGLINQERSLQTLFVTRVHNRRFYFHLPANNFPQYVNITYNGHPQNDLFYYLVETGDKINLDFHNDVLTIGGAKSKNFKIQYAIRQLENNFHKNRISPDFSATTLEQTFDAYDSLVQNQNNFLKNHKQEVSAQVFNVLSTQIFAAFEKTKFDLVYSYGSQYLDSLHNPIVDVYQKYLFKHNQWKSQQIASSPYCSFYVEFLFDKYKVDSCLIKKQEFQIQDCLTYIYKNFSGRLREQLFTYVICENKQFPKELKKIVDDALSFVVNVDYRRILTQIQEMRIDGAEAYNFILKDTENKIVQLQDLKGQVVVLDFWFTGCENCRELAPILARLEKDLNTVPVKFVSISIDKNRSRWLKSLKDGTYSSTNALNLYTGGEGTEHSVIKNYHVINYPTLVLITKNGTIVNTNNDPRIDDAVSLKEQIVNCLK